MGQIILLVSMLMLGIVYTIIYHFLPVQLFNNWLIHCIILGSVFGLVNYLVVAGFWKRYNTLKKINTKLKTELRLDKLTQLYNRKAFDLDIEDVNFEYECAVLFIDIDNFRKFNNEYGHDVGDSVLIKVANMIQKSVRATDRVYRYGGEEIVVICNNCNKRDALIIGEKIRFNIEHLKNTPYPTITVSIGIAVFPNDSHKFLEVINAADLALLRAKQLGKNRCIAAVKEDLRCS